MPELSDDEIRRLIGEIVVDSRAAEAAWQVLRELGPPVAPYLLDAWCSPMRSGPTPYPRPRLQQLGFA